ncbi:hypothetical protein BC828DRAFT_375175 [Blastocladiella britannica]|nr:hypothetical protein BC828DRAFT_375175 [Blastocladiella britannica]
MSTTLTPVVPTAAVPSARRSITSSVLDIQDTPPPPMLGNKKDSVLGTSSPPWPVPESTTTEVESWRSRFSLATAARQDSPLAPVASYLLQPRTLFRIRCVVLAYCLAITVIGLAYWIYIKITSGVSWMEQFLYLVQLTNWMWYGLLGYFALSIRISLRSRHGWHASTSASADPIVSDRTRQVHALLYAFNCTFHPLIVVIAWWKMSNRFYEATYWIDQVVMLSQHGLTLLLVVFEIVCSGNCLRPTMVIYVFLTLVAYGASVIVFFFLTNIWPYEFLDLTNNPNAKYMYLVCAAATFLAYAAMYGLHALKSRLFHGRSLILADASAASKRASHVSGITV